MAFTAVHSCFPIIPEIAEVTVQNEKMLRHMKLMMVRMFVNTARLSIHVAFIYLIIIISCLNGDLKHPCYLNGVGSLQTGNF